MEFKREAVEYAEKNGNRKAVERLYVPVKRIRKWKQKNRKYLNQQLQQRQRDQKVVG